MSTPDAIASRSAPLLAPVSAAEPGGTNATYDPRYETVRNEIGKLDTPTGGEVQWPEVVRGAQDLLTGVTKDFLIASQHAVAMLQHERWEGLAVGLAVVDGMLERWWEVGFPPVARLRGRANALDWLVARLEIAVPTLGVQPTEGAMFEACCALWSSVAARATDRLGELTPAVAAVTAALGRVRPGVPPGILGADAAPAAAAPSPAAATPSPAAAEPPSAAPPQASAPPPEPEAPPPAPEPAAPPADPLAESEAAAATWLEPIPGDNPAGSDVRYEAGYEIARLEIAKMESVTDSTVQWKLVHDHASSLLRTKAKDLLMAAYMTFAKLKQSGIREFVVGLMVLHGLLETYWDGLLPERLRGRANAMSWMVDQLDKALGEIKLEPKDRADVLSLQKAVSRIAGSSRERMGSEGPSFGPVSERIQRMLLAVPEEKPAPPPPPPQAAKPTSAPAPSATPAAAQAQGAPVPSAAAPSSPEGVTTFLQESGRNLVTAANQLRGASTTNPTAYRLMRVGLYVHLEGAPPSDPGGKTQIPPLPAPKRTQLATLEANGKWEALLEESEGALPTARFCLDLHRYTHVALERLGEAHFAARQIVVSELAAVLGRMPQVIELAARDGTPLSDGDTKTWITQIVLAGTGAAAPAAAGPAGSADDAKLFAEVRGLLVGGKAIEAMRIGQGCIDAATSPRQRFVRRLGLAGALLEGNQPMLARGLFAALERELREHDLFAWEPELAGRCLEGFVRAIRATAKAGARYEQADVVYERLCLVDPTAAARLAT